MNTADHVWAVVMAGGIGSRFWPVSRAERPKQLLDLFGDGPMLRVTLDRVAPFAPPRRRVVVTGEILLEAVAAVATELTPEHILCEPCGRNTAPAVAWAALHALKVDPEAVLMVLPADQHIGDLPGYHAVVAQALDAAVAHDVIVTLGITPTRPETGYGYIQRGDALGDGVYRAARFAEKPDVDTALGYLAAGDYAWNAGMFFATARRFWTELTTHAPELATALEAAHAAGDVAGAYPALTGISIDYAVMERSDRVAVIPGSFGWSDVGSWRSLWDFRSAERTSFHQGDVIEIDGGRNVLFADGGGLVATVGLRDLIVVHTPDATLVCPREHAQRAREVVKALQARTEETS